MKNSYITRAISSDGSVRAFIINSTKIVDEMKNIHNTSKTMTAAMGRIVSVASLMGCMLKDPDNTLTLQFKGDGPAGKIIAVSDYMGNVRCCADFPDVEIKPKDNGKLDVSGVVGYGSLYVIKDMGMVDPYVGISPIITGEIAEDITNYFATSEQTPSVCALGVRVNQERECYAAGGYIVQVMPGADDSIISKLENNVSKVKPVSDMVAEGLNNIDILAILFDGIEYEIFDEYEVSYKCNCSREKYFNALVSLPDKDIEELSSVDEPIETCCHFCNMKYTFDIKDIIKERNDRKAK